MRFWIKALIVLAVAGGAVGGASYATWFVMKRRYDPAKATQVRLENVTRGELAETISAPGVIQPRKRVKISAKVSARITEIPIEEGDPVTAGDPRAVPPVPASVLIRLDDRDLRSRLRAARATRAAMASQLEVEKATLDSQRADLAALEATHRQAERDYERKRKLVASRDIPEAVLDEARSRFEGEAARLRAARLRLIAAGHGLEVLRHRIEGADADIEQAEETLEYTVIRSPIDGTVTSLNAEEGEVVVTGTMNNAGTVILEVADLDSMILVAEVDEADVGKVAPGQPATVHVQAYPATDIEGTVETIALTQRRSPRGTNYYRTEIRLEPAPVKLYSGLTANVDIRIRLHTGVLTAPSQSILGRKVDELPEKIRSRSPCVDPDKTYATVVYRVLGGKTVVTPVKIGPADMTRTVILAGLEEAARIVSGPYKVLNGLKHDQKVEPEPAADADTNPQPEANGKTDAGPPPAG